MEFIQTKYTSRGYNEVEIINWCYKYIASKKA
jgi:hypothetical protein